ncbi:LysM peptidoglycan-binding domain-containing protein [Pelobium sp.]|nr:LysM peptidoglycan-binding domain-containing protein [Pelobium sp.]MDA9555329.1 LysM peptidoglycan-binding domain-containing protein [Pelobium sp.]
MNYKSILFLLLSFISFKAFSKVERDSIGVENLNGKKVILHKIEAKETYYSLGRRYGVNVQSIMEFNKNAPLHPSDIVKIPTQQNFNDKLVSFSSPAAKNNTDKTGKEILHKVMPKETLYGIASKYHMKVEDLKKLNNLEASNLKIGQTIKVISTDEVEKPSTTENKDTDKVVVNTTNDKASEKKVDVPQFSKIKHIDTTDSQRNIDIPKNRYGITEVNEKGLAVWLDDNNLDATKSYALHRTAPVGTIVKITNPMTNRSVFAKVVGKFTENETTKDVIIVMTKASADAIGALDKRFLVNITFGLPNEQQ